MNYLDEFAFHIQKIIMALKRKYRGKDVNHKDNIVDK